MNDATSMPAPAPTPAPVPAPSLASIRTRITGARRWRGTRSQKARTQAAQTTQAAQQTAQPATVLTPSDQQLPADIDIQQLSVHVAGRAILHGISAYLQAGTLTALVGPNGAGKSTLLNAIAGDVRPSSGQVLLAGQPVHTYPARQLARRRSFMLQDHRVRFAFTVADVVAMGRQPHKPNPDYDHQCIEAAMREAEVDHLGQREVPTLSGGEAARVMFARTLAQQCPVVLLDEPTAALDLRHQNVLLQRSRQLALQGACVVAVLHDLNLAARFADRVVILSGGGIAADGAPGQVLTRDVIERVYDQSVTVLRHPTRGTPLVIPD